MTVSTTNARDVKAGNGSTRTFAISFEFYEPSDLSVTLVKVDGTRVSWTLNQQYTVSGGGGSTGSLTTTQNNTVQSGEKLVIERVTPLVQPVDLVPNDFLPAETLEDVADILTFQVQELREVTDQALRISPALTGLSQEQLALPENADLSNSVLIFENGSLKTAPFQQAGVTSWNGLVGPVTTDALPEGSNLYYTAERAQDDTLGNIVGGNGVSVLYDDGNGSALVSFSGTTDNVSEGSTNLYHTDERAQDAAWSIASGGNGVTVSYDDASGAVTVSFSGTTDNVSEGSTNLYHTDERAKSAVFGVIDQRYVTPEDYGAAGDYDPQANTGTDDSTAVEDAYNAGPPVYLRDSNYLVTTTTARDAHFAGSTLGPGAVYYDDGSTVYKLEKGPHFTSASRLLYAAENGLTYPAGTVVSAEGRRWESVVVGGTLRFVELPPQPEQNTVENLPLRTVLGMLGWAYHGNALEGGVDLPIWDTYLNYPTKYRVGVDTSDSSGTKRITFPEPMVNCNIVLVQPRGPLNSNSVAPAIANVDGNGFDMEIVDSSNSRVSRNFCYLAVGN